MAKEPTPQVTAWNLLGTVAACFFGIFCLYHALFWVWQAAAFHSNKEQAWSHVTLWLALAALSALVWCRLVWVMYFPKKKY
jgi:uncharacterized membrane protein